MDEERNSTTGTPFTVAIVGGGLVGSLAAMTLAKRGWFVELYELRKGASVMSRTCQVMRHVHGLEQRLRQ